MACAVQPARAGRGRRFPGAPTRTTTPAASPVLHKHPFSRRSPAIAFASVQSHPDRCPHRTIARHHTRTITTPSWDNKPKNPRLAQSSATQKIPPRRAPACRISSTSIGRRERGAAAQARAAARERLARPPHLRPPRPRRMPHLPGGRGESAQTADAPASICAGPAEAAPFLVPGSTDTRTVGLLHRPEVRWLKVRTRGDGLRGM